MQQIANRLDRLYESDTRALIRTAIQQADQFIGITEREYIFPIKVIKPEFDFFSSTVAGFLLEETDTGFIGSICFNPLQYIMTRGEEAKKLAMELSILEERLHCIQAMLNPALRANILKLTKLLFQKKDNYEQGYNSDAEIAEMFDTTKQLEDRIKRIALFFEIPLANIENEPEAQERALKFAFANSDMDIQALRYIAELFCERFNLDKRKIPKRKRGYDPEREERIYVASFIRNILTNPAYFPDNESKLKLIEEFNVVLDHTVELKIQISNSLMDEVPGNFLEKARDYLLSCNRLNILYCIGTVLGHQQSIPFKQRYELTPRLNNALREGNVAEAKDILITLLENIQEIDYFVVSKFIDAVIDGEEGVISAESAANAIAFYQFGDLPADPIARAALLANKDYIGMLARELHNQTDSPLNESGFQMARYIDNPKDAGSIESIGEHSSIADQVDLSGMPKLIKDKTTGIWQHLVAINAKRILEHKNKKREGHEIVELDMQIAKLRNERDLLCEPIAKVIREFIKFGQIDEDYVYVTLKGYSDLFTINESTFRTFIHNLANMVSSGDKSRIKKFLRIPSFLEQLSFMGIEG